MFLPGSLSGPLDLTVPVSVPPYIKRIADGSSRVREADRLYWLRRTNTIANHRTQSQLSLDGL